MNFNGTIIITDPCYIATGGDWNDSKKFYYEDWALRKINIPEITTYFWNAAGQEDGSWEVVGLNKITNRVESEKFIAEYYKAVNNFIKQPGIKEVIVNIPTDKPATYNWSCGMDMFHGKVVVK